MLLKKLYSNDFLSFGEKGPDLTLGPLNVLIGPNGSGKSNFIELVSVLRGLSSNLTSTLQSAGGGTNLVSKHSKNLLSFSVVAEFFSDDLFFAKDNESYRFGSRIINFGGSRIGSERFQSSASCDWENPKDIIIREGNEFVDCENNKKITLQPAMSEESIMNFFSLQSDIFTEIISRIRSVRIYRDRATGRSMPARWPQPADARNDFLEENTANLGLVLNYIRQHPKEKRKLLHYLQLFYEGITDFNVLVQSNTVQIFLEEGDTSIPASRLSDGTLHYLCLLAILCHPKSPSLICIEEPEVGLHPDMMRALSELLIDASERSQIIVTTHSDALIDALTSRPEVVVVCERHNGITEMRRLERESLKDWLEKYSLGELWVRGDIGGTRW